MNRDRCISGDTSGHTAQIYLAHFAVLGGADPGAVEGNAGGIAGNGEGQLIHLLFQQQGGGYGDLTAAVGGHRGMAAYRGCAGSGLDSACQSQQYCDDYEKCRKTPQTSPSSRKNDNFRR